MVSPTCMFDPPTCTIWPLWSPLPYMEQVSSGLLTCTYGPPHVQYDVNSYCGP